MKLFAISEMYHFKYNEKYFLHDFHVTSKLSFYAVRQIFQDTINQTEESKNRVYEIV